jgi:hypothetical protein
MENEPHEKNMKKNYRPSAKKVVDQVDRSRAFAYLLLYFFDDGVL